MRTLMVDGGPDSIRDLTDTLRAALLDDAAAVLPVGPAERVDDMRPDLPAEPGTAVVLRTSGSTGAPKGVLLSAGALIASAEATHRRLGGPGGWLLAMPAHHIAGVQVIVRSVLAGTPPGVLPGGGFTGDRFVAAAADVLGMSGPRYTALVPTQLTRLLAEGGAALSALRSFDAVLVGGAATAPATLARARDAGVAVVTTYGMTETAGGCVYDGVPLDGVQVRLTGQGLIDLGGPTLAHGYRLAPAETAAAFGGGWFHTADLGSLVHGRLEVLGRADDIINTGGEKVSPGAVERVLVAHPAVSEACVVGVPDAEWGHRVTAAVVAAPGTDPAELASVVRVELGPHAVPRPIRLVPELPLRGPGKIDRTAVTALLAAPIDR
ncbi:o-succinylbenzoate--CoA ligase [Actinokineospora enzanensis]|uniref:o-succinylbenzoate--CoA ligase n=1 Tax=Actinokineospora enzanensis TaxID=155975 RepID=UPI0003824FE8|nr:o-succinylbenzoate--CoA ligase [Actinokineospora enzanensis]